MRETTKKPAPVARAKPNPCLLAAALALLLALGHAHAARAQWATSGANVHNTNTGNVGVGTNSPSAKLDVTFDGNAVAGLRVFDTRPAGAEFGGHLLFFGNSSGTGTPARFGQITGLKENATQGSMLGFLGFYTNDGAATYSVVERMRINSAGNVGIGTTSPQSPLSFAQGGIRPRNINSGGLEFTNTAGGTLGGLHNNVAGDYSYLNLMRPGGALDTGDFQAVALGPAYQSTGLFAANSVVLSARSNFTAGMRLWSEAGPLKLYAGAFTAPARVTVDTAGNVGVGIAMPTERLHVEGNLKVTGNIEARYQDVAEWVPTVQQLRAGTVVVLDPARSNHVLASASSYDTSVAGVVSARPGIILGEGGEGKVKVATTGRVKVRVDATKGAIKIGDLLVTGDSPGVAMKSVPVSMGGTKVHRPGTIIGKALEPLEKGVAEILVLLSMQ